MSRKIIKTDQAPEAIGPYSQAISVGGFVFVSGQIPLDPKTNTMIEADIAGQSKQVLENAKAVLAAAGCGMQHVVKTTIYLKNMSDFSAVNEVYGVYFPGAYPARATVEVARLPKDAGVEMDFIAWKE